MNATTIILDLDNTLLRSDKAISAYTISVLGACQRAGVKVVFATARSVRASARMLSQFSPDIFIGYGGSLAQTANRDVIYRSDIPAEVSLALIGECLKTPEVSYIYAVHENDALTNDSRLSAATDYTHYRYVDFSHMPSASYLKVSVEATCPGAVGRIAANYLVCDMLRFAGEDLYRFANRAATKWNAIKAVSEQFNICPSTFIAFGDDRIDMEMLQNCGTGVAVANAIPDVRAVANQICDTNENDGVAKWLAANVL